MNNIENLLMKMCPDGIQFKKIKEICSEVIVPMRDRPKVFDGEIPWCRIEDIEGKFFNKSLSGLKVSQEVIKEMNLKVFPMGTVICSCSASIGVYAINTQPLITNQTFIGLVCGKEICNKYLLYFMETQTKNLIRQATTGTIPYISRNKFEELEVPVPPMEIQQEIVRILDRFTELEAGLQAELDVRKKQYEYYKMKLLSFGEDVPVKELRKTCNMKAGKAISASNISESKNEVQKYACFGGNGVRGYVEFQSHKGEYPLIGRQGALCGNVNYATGDFYATEHAVVVTSLGEYTQRFLYYLLMAMNLNQYKSQGAQPGLAVGNIEKLLAPVPTIEEQQRIVTVLDTFEVICNDYSRGLPAEIEARHKQYEHYRDKLLTFKRKVV